MTEFQMDEQDKAVLDILDLVVSEGGSLGNRLLLEDKQIDALVVLAIKQYQAKQYESAASVFQLLTLVDVLEPKHFKHLGACYQGSGDYDRAVKAYMAAVALDPLDPEIQFHAGQCLYLMRQLDRAFFAVNGARLAAERDPQKWEALLPNINALLARLPEKK